MQILAHRGWWTTPAEQNTLAAFRRAFAAGFGVELDVRDAGGVLAVAHDPTGYGFDPATALDPLVVLDESPGLPVAVNVKASGLAPWFRTSSFLAAGGDWFAFDVPWPDVPAYLAANIPTFLRVSPHETPPRKPEGSAVGVWVDFPAWVWPDVGAVRFWLSCGYRVALVSPELHGNPCEPFWGRLKTGLTAAERERVLLCTDHPDKCREFFA